jgi:predicted transcriptional regulator YdeE
MGNIITTEVENNTVNIDDFENVEIPEPIPTIEIPEHTFHVTVKENQTSWIERYWIRFWIRWELFKKTSRKYSSAVKEWVYKKYRYGKGKWKSKSKQVNPEPEPDEIV